MRSGEYKQCFFRWHIEDSFCALGLGLDVYAPDSWEAVYDDIDYEGIPVYQPSGEAVAGLRFHLGLTKDELKLIIYANNHSKWSFPRIADYIEELLAQRTPPQE